MKKSLLLLIIAVILISSVMAQSYIGLREIISYAKQDYNAGAQNWDIRQDVQGRIYFANNEGLLCFDGIYWKLYPLPNRTIVRSIEFGKDNRIYIGGQDELGFFVTDPNGRLRFHSLIGLIPEIDRKFADIWDIVQYGNEIFFRSNNKIFRYSNGKITVYHPSTGWLFIGLNDNQLLAQDEGRGLLIFNGTDWEPYADRAILPAGLDITDMMSIGRDSCLITSHKNGLLLLNNKKLEKFNLTGLPCDPNQIFSSVSMADKETFIVGTYNNGFYLIHKNGSVTENFSRKEGLQNSNVRSLFMDRNRNIWLGLDSGIDFIAFNNTIKHINPPIMNDGAGYAVIRHTGNLYFALSNGIYELPLQDIKDFSYTPNNCRQLSGGEIWGLYLINNNLLAAGNEGFSRIIDERVVPVSKNTGFWTFQPMQDHQKSDIIVAGNYHGVKLFEKEGTEIREKTIVNNFTESARFLVIDDNNVIWVSHPYRGVYKIQQSGGVYAAKLYTKENGLPSSLENHVYKIKNKVVIATIDGIYEYDQSSDSFIISSYYKEIFEKRSVRYLKDDPDGNIWFVQDKNLGVVDFSTLKPSIIYLPELKGKIMSGFEHVYPINANNIFVGGEKGFYHINYEKYRQTDHPLKVYISTVRIISKNDSLIFGGYYGNVNEDRVQLPSSIPSVSHRLNSLHIEFCSPLFEQQTNIEYSYMLNGFDKEWSDWSKKTEKDYTNLPAGNYEFKVKMRNNLRNESEVSSYSFVILPPWYQTIWAYLIYAAIAIWFIYFLYRKHKKKLLRERNKHIEEQKRQAYLHQLELEKSEKELVKLRNEKLEAEIEFKNSELATTAMHLVQKEEFLVKIKEELQHLNKSGKEKPDTTDLKKILRFLSEEEKLNEEWEQFSVHFNKVHSNFLIVLKDRYPDLKAHELKLCAYLRMNLSSKEIAQLMSISVRGVEISRYRLRKKLQIPTEVNLFQFLFDIQRETM